MVKEHNGSFVIAVTLRDEENQCRGPSGQRQMNGTRRSSQERHRR